MADHSVYLFNRSLKIIAISLTAFFVKNIFTFLAATHQTAAFHFTCKTNSVIHEFTPVGRANHYISSLKAYSIVKVDRFETGAPEINLQSTLDCSKSPSDCEHKPRTPRALTSPKKQLESLSSSH
ncbi:hypothetical protein DY000_02054061 [Brassica cretica]|uniref:Uncharacterized protein n=1 Tax=Brassica cretica TaxID=69181 RepID=A0ABQ7AHS8_BRACR|nr:hypothetical protein DY000_02054061 [Brassica cretica]